MATENAKHDETISLPAEGNVSLPKSEVGAPDADELFRMAYERSMKTIFAEYAQHEIFYKTLLAVREDSDEDALNKRILALPEMKVHLRAPRYYLDALHACGALDRVAVADATVENVDGAPDPDGIVNNLPPDAVGSALSDEDEAAVDGESVVDPDSDIDENGMPRRFDWFLNAVGDQLVEDLSPVNRLSGLLDDHADVAGIYTDILDFCTTPRKRTEIEELLDDKKALEGLGVVASFFTDGLEQNGGLIWKDGWTTTPEGEVCLRQRIQQQQ